ncbi:MAG: type II secretion system F family protein [Allorhizobium sp.]
MPRFNYVGYSKDGSKKRGSLDAQNASDASKRIKAGGIRVLQLSLSSGQVERPPTRIISFFQRRTNVQRFFFDLALLMEAGLGLDRALKAIASEPSNGGNHVLASELLTRLSNGMSPSEAFQTLEHQSPGTTALISSAEQTGKLQVVFSVIAADLDMRKKRRSEMLEALTYPALLLMLTLVALAIVAVYLVPAILPVFEGANTQPPLLIRALDKVGTGLRNWAGPTLFVSVLILLLLARKVGRKRLRMIANTALLALPFIGELLRKQGLARYMRSLALLLANGVSMQKALVLSVDVCPFPRYRMKLEAMRERIVGGERFSEALLEARIFPGAVTSLIAIGDEVNSLPPVLERSAALLEEEAMRAQKTLLALMTPSITIIMGLLIGTLVMSVMSALLSINQMSTL